MDGDIEALVVHPFLLDARPQMRLSLSHRRSHRMSGTARRIDDDVAGRERRALGRETKFYQQRRYVFFKSFRSGIFFGDNGVEFGLRILEFGLESVVPDV